MLTATFIHTPGISPGLEQQIWDLGIHNWEDFLDRHEEIKLPNKHRWTVVDSVEESISRLKAGDHRFFAGMLPYKEHWRAVPEFNERIAYVDVEMTEMSDNGYITLIGLFDGHDYRHFIRGRNLHHFPEELEKYTTLVTFFGSTCDLPIIRRHFNSLKLDVLHVDLCFMFRRMGISGGLKAIERSLGIRRPRAVAGLNGKDAIRLWNDFRNGDDAALDLLLAYNREDARNLSKILPYAYEQLWNRVFRSKKRLIY